MKLLIFLGCLFLCACSHTERKIEFVEVTIPDDPPRLILKEIPVVEPEFVSSAFPEIRFENDVHSYWICGGVYPSSIEKLASLSLEELEKNYGALVVTKSYKKWIPINGEPETVLVFNFKK